jgi:hypothetical protein
MKFPLAAFAVVVLAFMAGLTVPAALALHHVADVLRSTGVA